MNIKRIFLFALVALMLCLPVWAMAAQTIFIGNGETVTLSGTLAQGCDIQVDGSAALVLDQVNITALRNDYAALNISGDGSLKVVFRGGNVLTHSNIYGIFCKDVSLTLAPDGANAFLQVNAWKDGIDAVTLKIGAGAKIGVSALDGDALYCSDGLNIGPGATLDLEGGWHGLNVRDSITVGQNAIVNVRGGVHGADVEDSMMTLEAGAEMNLYSTGAVYVSAVPLDLSDTALLIKNGAKLTALADVNNEGVELEDGSITVEAGGTLNVINNNPAGVGLIMDDDSFVQINSVNVTISGGYAAFAGEGEIRCGAGIIPQHRNAKADEWKTMTGSQTGLRYFRTAATPPPKTGDESRIVLWAALAVMSMLGMAALVVKRKEA